MGEGLTFALAEPAVAAASLDNASIHLWRLAHRPDQGRAPLLRLLAAYLELEPSAVHLQPDAGGKPRLALPRSLTQGLQFNWSHSGGEALVALSRGPDLGVDLEHLRKLPRVLPLARRYFDADEAATLAALDPAARRTAFLSLWCAKEAVLKATGLGLSFGLARLAFAREGDGGWQPQRLDPALGTVSEWQLRGLSLDADYCGALAWRGPPLRLCGYRWATPPA